MQSCGKLITFYNNIELVADIIYGRYLSSMLFSCWLYCSESSERGKFSRCRM